MALALSACSPPAPTPLAETPTSPATVAPSETPSALPSNTPDVTAVPSVTLTPQASPLPAQPVVDNPNFGLACDLNKNLDPKQVLETTPFFIKGQVILTGPAETINSTLGMLAFAGANLTPVIRCTLGIPGQMPDPNRGGKPFQKEPSHEGRDATFPFSDIQGRQPIVEGRRGLAIDLYQFDEKKVSLMTIIEQLNDLQSNLSPQARVYADPNYLTGHMANTACGNPFGVEGSPFGVEGSPFGVEGSPYGGMGLDADPDGFWEQWAFQRVGLPPPDKRQFEETGEGVAIGVFDTSPYTIMIESSPQFTYTNFITPQLKLALHYPLELSTLNATTPITPEVIVKDHGLFVSSLIHAFAYESQIHLYRVLDDNGCGDLYRLNIAILDFLSANWSSEGLRGPAVINLSLGVRKPAELPIDPSARAEALKEIGEMSQDIQDAYNLVESIRDPIESLDSVLQLANQAGIVIVAAAGNDSVLNNPPVRTPLLLNMPLPADLPADLRFVVGVSASTITDGPACYSNLGDVAAPGGDAAEGSASRSDGSNEPICVSMAATCPPAVVGPGAPPPCPYGVIGLATISHSSYGYWVGTSFATPMVSGMAALVYQHLGVPGETATRITSRVGPIRDTRYGDGLIQVQAALYP